MYVRCILAATWTILWQMMGAGGRFERRSRRQKSRAISSFGEVPVYCIKLSYVTLLCYVTLGLVYYIIILYCYGMLLLLYFLWHFMFATEQLKQQQACLRVDCPVVHSYKSSFTWPGFLQLLAGVIPSLLGIVAHIVICKTCLNNSQWKK